MIRLIGASLAGFHRSHRYPIAVIATLGFGGFLLDYLWKPVSTAGLILLAMTASPWIIRVIRVKKGSLAGWEFELGYPSEPGETGERLAEELRQDEGEPAAQSDSDVTTTEPNFAEPGTNAESIEASDNTHRSEHRENTTDNRRSQVARVYMAEGLVFQELQREFGGTVQREVRIGPYAVDGIVFGPSGPVAVEVKLVSTGKAIKNRLVEAGARLLHLSLLGGEKYSNIRPLLAVVVEGMDAASDNWRRRLREFKSEFPRIDVRTFSLDELLNKYGIRDPE